ncbi:MAG: alpha/beta hydrolase [Faecalibacterium sp.]|nr:alpha/beta hydrolase [Ruminococcus sp.]MCM1391895.1 alpha/beta hydrolase [Ruminococcus sp.]MCM1485631.1 alpha/beta hydrolase [Faecalibacterium sp.]
MNFTEAERKKIKALEKQYNLGEAGLYFVLYKPFKGMQEQKDIQYLNGKRTQLDIIRKKNISEKRPLFIYIHGGGWISGWRKARRYYCRHWAEQGFVCANIGYDYALGAEFPQHIRQLFKGIEYVLDRADEYGIDSKKVVIAGESSGAHLAALTAAVASHKNLYDALGIDFKYKDSFNISSCVLMSGIFDPVRSIGTGFKDMDWFVRSLCGMNEKDIDEELKNNISPSHFADEKFPPSYIIGSDKDLLLAESKALHAELDGAGVKNELFVCTGINGVHAGALACHVGSGRTAVKNAKQFVLDAMKAAEDVTIK